MHGALCIIYYLCTQNVDIMNENIITSLQNERVKRLVTLQQKASERRKSGVFVVEGMRELTHCQAAGYEVDTVFICDDYQPSGHSLFPVLDSQLFHVTPAVYEKIAYRGSTEGIIAQVRERKLTLDNLKLSANPLVIVLESVEKPGNIGAVLRSADAAHADAVIVCNALTDLYNPNLIRASLGALFSVPTIACGSDECISFLKQNNIQILTAQLQDSNFYYDIDMRQPTAIVMGTESTGLTDTWRQAADAHIRIPMLGAMDSLNVSVSAAILLFEAVRQRMCQ